MNFDDLVQNTGQDNKKYFEILKEYSNPKNVNLFSELTDREVRIFTRLMFLEWLINERFNVQKGQKKVLDFQPFFLYFLKNKVSLERKSRKEFLESFKADRSHEVGIREMRTGQMGNMRI